MQTFLVSMLVPNVQFFIWLASYLGLVLQETENSSEIGKLLYHLI